MKRLIRFAAGFYPASWRRRYGVEFDALLEDANANWQDVFDVLGGAIRMQVSTLNARNITIACGLLGLIIATGWAFSLPKMYVSRAVLRVQTPARDAQATAEHVNRIWQTVTSRGSLSEIIQRPSLNLYKKDRSRKPLEEVIQDMKARDIQINLLSTSPSARGSFLVSFRYPDPIKAQQVTNALITKLVDANFRFSRHAVDPKMAATLDLLDPASLPKNPTAPNRLSVILAGLALGVVAGVLTVGIRRWPWIAASAFGGLLLGLAAYALLPKTYVSQAVLRTNAPQQLPVVTTKVLSDEFLKSIVEEENLYPRARERRPVDEVIRDMRNRDLRIEVIQSSAIAISFRYTDRYKTQHVVIDVANALFRGANQDDDSVAPHRPLEFLDGASFPEQPTAPHPPEIAGAGMGAGLLCGLIARWLRR